VGSNETKFSFDLSVGLIKDYMWYSSSNM